MDEAMDGGGAGVFSGDEWEQAQYLPSTTLATAPFGPKTKKPAPTKPDTTNLGRILTGDEWEQAQKLPAEAIKVHQLPAIPQVAAPRDLTATARDQRTKGTPLAPFDVRDPTTYANPVLRQIVNPALDNPLTTVTTSMALGIPGVGHVLGLAMAGSMVHNIASYGWQKAAESQLSPEDRKRAEADPDRISGEAAAMQAAMLGLAPLIHVGVKAYRGLDVSGGVLEAGARGVGELRFGPDFAPDHPPTPGEETGLNKQFAASLDQGAATARIPTSIDHPAGFQPTATETPLRVTPRPVAGLEVPRDVTPGKVKPLETLPANATAEERAAYDQSVRDYQAERVTQDEADLSAARTTAAEKIAKADAMRPRRRPATGSYFETEQGAQVLGAMAARHGLPETASPYHPESPLDAVWREGHDAASPVGAGMLRSLSESGFATTPVEASSVILPSSGAGRAGSTVDAIATAKRLVGPDGLRRLADAELARRGGEATPEARMAAMEQVARDLASLEPRPAYPEGFSMGGALTDNRIPGADELPAGARGTDVPEGLQTSHPVPDGATPETAALAAALKPSPYRGHSSDALADAALDAQTAIEHAQEGVVQSRLRGLVGEAAQADMENRGTSYSDESEAPSVTQDRLLARAKARLAQIEREFALRGVTGDALAEIIQGAKELRLEREGMQQDQTLAELMADKVSPPDEQRPPAERVPGALAQVAGTGEAQTRGLAASVERKALVNKLTTGLGELPEYKAISMTEQADRAGALLAADPALARRVALGEAPAPDGLLPESVFVAVENRAIEQGDVATIRDLATGKLTSDATTMGQRIRALGERDPESPVGAIKKVLEVRMGGAKDVPRATAETVAQIRAQLKAATITPGKWAEFVNSLRC